MYVLCVLFSFCMENFQGDGLVFTKKFHSNASAVNEYSSKNVSVDYTYTTLKPVTCIQINSLPNLVGNNLKYKIGMICDKFLFS